MVCLLQALAREVDDKVFFAGEHTSKTHPAQVVGALLSGVQAAGRVASCFGKHRANHAGTVMMS